MVAEARVWVDVEAAVREWARDAGTSAERRVFFGYSDQAAQPQLTLFRVSGPDDSCLIQFDAWARTKADAASLAAELATAADALGRYTFGGAVLHGAAVQDVRWQPDFEDNEPRYIVEVVFFAMADGLES